MSAGFVVPSKGSAIRNDLTLNNLKTKQSSNIPKFPNGKLPLPGSYLAVQGNIAFEQSATPGLENTDGTLMVYDGTAWVTTGDVSGPASSTDNAVARFDGTTGKVIQNSLVIIDDAGNLTTPGNVTAANISGVNTGNVTLAPVDSNGAPNANAATLSGVTGQVLNLNSASSSQPGVVNTTTQSFLGAKTFVTSVGVPNTTSSTAGVFTIGGVPFLHNAGAAASNVFLGVGTGNFTLTGAGNIGIGGDVLSSVTTGVNNIGIGTFALNSVDTGADNIALGLAALQNITSGNQNVAIGSSSMSAATTTANQNTGVGYHALQPITTGFGNIALGHNAGSALPPTADHTVTIAHSGAGIANGSMHIGSAGTQTTTFISGIQGVTPPGAGPYQVVIDTNGQLGSALTTGIGINDIGAPSAPTVTNEGAHITAPSTLNLEFADATHNGIVSTTTQSFGGLKTFTNDLAVSNAIAPAANGTLYYVLFQGGTPTWANTAGAGPLTAPVGPIPADMQRINGWGIISFGSMAGTGSGTAGTILSSVFLPVFMQPVAANRVYAVPVIDNNVRIWGNMEVYDDGDPNAGRILLSTGLAPGGTFSGTGVTGFDNTQIFYRIG